MDLLLSNEDALVYLFQYIHSYTCKNYLENTNEINSYKNIIFILCHTSKYFRNKIQEKKYNFPTIKSLMIQYKKEIVLPKLLNELDELNKRKPILEKYIKYIPIQLEILENNENIIYFDYVNQTIHHRDCTYSFTPNEYYPDDNINLERMKLFFKENNFKNEKQITNFLSMENFIKNKHLFYNFRYCNKTLICKCLNKEIKNEIN